MLIGYARVSTTDQTLDLQLDALRNAGCTKTFTDTVSGGAAERPGLAEAFSHLRDGDTLVVWRLDRLGRSLTHLIETITKLHSQGIGFKSLTEQIDTTTSGGEIIFPNFCAPSWVLGGNIPPRPPTGGAAAPAPGGPGGPPKN